MRAWNRGSAAFLMAVALVLVINTRRLLAYNQGADSQIFARVTAELAKEARFQNLTVEVDDRLVKLRGTVSVLEDKREALRKAGAAKGVKIVVSHIKVRTAPVDDSLLLQQLTESLAENRDTDIQLKVKKGVVTIQGTVQHDAHRERILSSVASIPGVIGMEDRLQLIGN